ncbi:DUF3592 domain-containing protein [Fulvivirga sediminis]|uniref:DUF3592 domain-containing protein n=1 Tax=Fulvivirga sediminis TaxID=2803949 RepID=A0A937F743_9BACT|nr:DUF3592 domain-containing protein [Fulvivirga sediminis]MBL3655203.1 DUF3592 domain-containing protein [Fulvivirga sediminis]
MIQIWVPLILGGILFIIGLYFYLKCQELMSKGKRTMARVNDFVLQKNMYYPIINYTTENDEVFIEKLNIGSNPPKYKKGDQIPIIYSAQNPQDFMIDDPVYTEVVYKILMAVGLIAVVICGMHWLGYINIFPD